MDDRVRSIWLLLAGGVLLAMGSLPSAVAAQQPPSHVAPGPFARMVVLEPKPGQQAAFEAGYQRHLEWHRNQKDPWTWYGWSFVTGERIGLFMDGTFGHDPANFDAAVQPAADAADNAANVSPHADFRSHGIYERLDTLSRGAPLPDTSAVLSMITYYVVPGREQTFEAAISARRNRSPGEAARYTWLRLRTGGTTPQYVLLRSASSFGTAAVIPDFWDAGGHGPDEPSLQGVVASVRSELLRYRPTLSYHP